MPQTPNTDFLDALSFNGRYQVLQQECLGKGSFGTVYKGQHILLGIEVAIKLLHADLLTRQETERFIKEAQTASRLNHPNIIKIYDADFAGHVPFIVMEFCPHGNLLERHPLGQPVAIDLVVTYMEQIADALQYVHNNVIVHRDVKPQNLLFGSPSRLVLSDFGIALTKETIDLLRTQVPFGSRPYAAPEQEQGKASYASDQYSLAVICYQLVTGKQPSLHTDVDWQLPHLAQVSAVLRKALSTHPADRYPSTRHFAEAFRLAATRGDARHSRVILNGKEFGSASEPTLPEEGRVRAAVPASTSPKGSEAEQTRGRRGRFPFRKAILAPFVTPRLVKRKLLRLHPSSSVCLSCDGKVLLAGPHVSGKKPAFRCISLEKHTVLFHAPLLRSGMVTLDDKPVVFKKKAHTLLGQSPSQGSSFDQDANERQGRSHDQYVLAAKVAESCGKSHLLAFAYNNATQLMTLQRAGMATEGNHLRQGGQASGDKRESIEAIIEIFNMQTGTWETPLLRDSLVESLRFSPDGKLLLIKEKDAGMVQIVCLETRRSVKGDETSSYYLLPGLKMLQIERGREINGRTVRYPAKVIDLETEDQLFILTVENDFRVFPEKQLLCTLNTAGKCLRVFSLETGTVLIEVASTSAHAASSSFSPGGKWFGVLTDENKNMQVFRIETGKEAIKSHSKEAIATYFFSPDDTLLVIIRNSSFRTTMQAIHLETGTILAESGWKHPVASVEFSREQKRVALLSTDQKHVLFLSVATGTKGAEVTTTSAIERVLFSSDSNLFAVTCKKNTLVGSSQTGEIIDQVAHNGISDTCFLPDKKDKFYIAISDALYGYQYRPRDGH